MMNEIRFTTVGHFWKCRAYKLARAFLLFTMLLLLLSGSIQAADGSGNRNWNISGSGVWDYTTNNWHDGLFATPFAAWDYAIFSSTGTYTITLSGGGTDGIETGGMKITDGSYTFDSSTGRKLIGRIQPANGDDSYQADGKLQLATSGTTIINIETDFETGTIITAGTLVIGHDKALGVYQYNPGLSTDAQRGQITVQGNNTNVRILANRNLQNRFVFSGGSSFYIASTALLTIDGVENTATGANGGAIYAGTGVSFTGGGSLKITDSFATNSGGAIYAQNLDLSALNALYFSGNEAAQGGALYVTGSLSIKGNAYFSGNKATKGGAIYMQGHSTGTLTANLDTSAGHVAFINNTGGSIYLNQNVAVSITGGNNVYFNDAAGLASGAGGGNSFTMNGAGLVQFTGANVLNEGAGGAVNVNTGTFRVVESASFSDNGSDAIFNLADGATLAGGGTIKSGTFTLQGIISPDKATYSTPTNIGSITSGSPAQTAPAASEVVGELKITGNVTFSKATMLVDIYNGAADLLTITGTAKVSADNKNTVDVTSFVAGSYKIMSATGGGFSLDAFNNVLVGGAAYSPRSGYVTLRVTENKQEVWLDMTARTGVYKVVWGGGTTVDGSTKGRYWNYTNSNTNWQELQTSVYDYFQSGDYAIFIAGNDGREGAVSVTQNGGVAVGGMDIQGGTYTFSGTAITSDSSQGGDVRLLVQNGASASFSNNVTLTGGMVNAGSVTLNKTNNSAGFGDAMAIINTGTLTFNIGASYPYEQKGLISGSGAVVKTGAGVLTLTGSHGGTGASLSQSQGALTLNGTWTGTFTQNTSAGDFSAVNNSTLTGTATFNTGVNLQSTAGDNQLKITGNMYYNAVNLKVALGASNIADNILVSNVAHFGGGADGAVTVKEWQVGQFTLISANSFNYVDGTKAADLENYTITFEDGPLTKRQSATLEVVGGKNLVLTTAQTNALLYWVSGANAWSTDNSSAVYWSDVSFTSPANDYFRANDYVVFGGNSAGSIVSIANSVTVAGMEIKNGTYTYNGAGSISGSDSTVQDAGKTFSATNTLLVNGGVGTFNVPVNFKKLNVTNGTINFASKGTFTEGITVDGGILRINNSGDLKANDILVNSPGSLYYSMTGGDPYIQDGKLSGNGTVYKNGAGTLTMRGDISANGLFSHSAGIVNLESSWKGAYTQSGAASVLNTSAGASIVGNYNQNNASATLNAGNNTSIGGMATLAGKVNLNGDNIGSMTTNTLHLNGATLNITTAASNASDRINVTGAVTFGNASTINVSDWLAGTYTLITSTGMVADADKNFSVNGTGGGVRDSYRLYVLNNNLMLEITAGGALDLVWNGAGLSDTWNTSSAKTNWLNGSSAAYFANSDSVRFIDNNAAEEVVLGENVTVDKMTVSGGNYTFTGEYSISGTGTNALVVTGSNTSATFQNAAVSFSEMQITNNAEVTIDNTDREVSLASTKIDNQSTLIYVVNRAYTQNGNLKTQGGTVIKNGSATLTFSGNIESDADSHFIQQVNSGTVDLQTDWAGDYSQYGGTLVTTGDRTIAGEVSLDGTLQVGGGSVAQLETGNLTLSGATLNITITSNTVYDKIVSTGALTLSGVNTIDISQFLAGTYTIVAGSANVEGSGYSFKDVTVGGSALTGRQWAVVSVVDKDLLLNLSNSRNISLVWAGTGAAGTAGGLWNITDANWTNGNLFVQSDFVTFDNTAANKTVDVFNTGANVAGMDVTGGSYVFRGGNITGVSAATGINATNTLTVSGSTTTAAFQNQITFAKGLY